MYRNQQLSGLNSQQQLLLQQQYLQLAAAGQIPGFPGAYPHPVIPGGGEQYLAGLPTVLPLPYYAGVPGWYPQTLLTNGAAATQAGALQLVAHEAPLATTVESTDGREVGVPGHLLLSTSAQLADKPVTSLAWSPDKAGLLAATSFDQSRHRPPFAADLLDADWPPAQVLCPLRPPRRHLWSGRQKLSSYRNIRVWATSNAARTIMHA